VDLREVGGLGKNPFFWYYGLHKYRYFQTVSLTKRWQGIIMTAEFYMHDQFELDMRGKMIGTAAYFFLVGAYFYTAKGSDTVVSSGALGRPGSIPMRALHIILAFAIGTGVFGLLPGKKICKKCGHSWRF